MPPTLEHRLRELSHEELIRLLLAVAGTGKNVAAFLMQETTPQKEKVAAIKRGISALTRVGSGRIRVPARKVADQILDLLRRIQSVAEQDAPTSYELMCRLLATESDISEHVDDSHGAITSAFRGRVVQARRGGHVDHGPATACRIPPRRHRRGAGHAHCRTAP